MLRDSMTLVLVACLVGCSSHHTGVPDTGSSDTGLAKQMASRETVPDVMLEGWLADLAARGDEGFVTEAQARDELLRYMVESLATTGFCLTDRVDPHRGAKDGVSWSARLSDERTPDCLRASWQAQGLSFTLTETANLLLIGAERVDGSSPPMNGPMLRQMIDVVVRLSTVDHEWTFEIPEQADLSRGTHLISTLGAPDVHVIETREDRADVLIISGRVWFVFYKKIAQRFGFEPEHAWFRDSTREALGG